MWCADKYNPIASLCDGILHFNDTVKGSVVYLLDLGQGNVYVGSTTNLHERLEQHAEFLRKGKHTAKIQKSFNESGVFNAYVLLNLPHINEDSLHEAENSMIHLVRPNLNTQIPSESSLSPNSTWEKAIPAKQVQKTEKPQFISLINTSDGPRTPHDVRKLCFFLHQDFQDEFMSCVYDYFFKHTFTYYLLPGGFRDKKIYEKSRELYVMMKERNFIIK